MAFLLMLFDLHLQSTGMISISGMISIIVVPSPWLSTNYCNYTNATLSNKVKQLHGDSMTRRSHKIIDNHMAPAGCRTRRHASREILQT